MSLNPLIITLGNDARGDDGAGLAVFNWLQSEKQNEAIDFLHVTQLQPEHLDLLKQRSAVLIVDCAQQQSEIIQCKPIKPSFINYFSSHIVPPDILLGWYQQLVEEPGPVCHLLSVRGEQFELGQGFSESLNSALPDLFDAVAEWICSTRLELATA